MQTRALLRGLRFIDSFFPSGSYGFSSGLEAAVQAGGVRNGAELARYVESLLRGRMGPREAVAVGLAQEAAVCHDLRAALVADRELDAMEISREGRLASRQMGRQVMRVAAEQEESGSILRNFLTKVETEGSPGHLAISLGLTLGVFGWSKEEAIAAFLYQSAVGLVSAALKLLPIGQREAQQLLYRWTPLIESLSRMAAGRHLMRSWTPVEDVYAMNHSRLRTRLFRS